MEGSETTKWGSTHIKNCLNLGIAQIMGDPPPPPYEIWAPKEHFSPGCSKNVNTVFVQWKSNNSKQFGQAQNPPPLPGNAQI